MVEDSVSLQRSLSAGLTNSGLLVDQAFDGDEADGYLRANDYDVVILDIMLPKLSGLEVLERLRHRGDNAPVLVLSARDEVEDKTRGLDLGADDYLAKPFSFDELVSRIRALHRRVQGRSPSNEVLEVEGVTIDPRNQTVAVGEAAVDLTPSEYRLLEFLARRRQRTFAHEQLIDRLYRSDQFVSRNAVEAHISSLRRKLREAGADDIVKTRRGFGYFIA
ncbi:MAG: response regulator transcription factor [Acidobacteriota bacterium]